MCCHLGVCVIQDVVVTATWNLLESQVWLPVFSTLSLPVSLPHLGLGLYAMHLHVRKVIPVFASSNSIELPLKKKIGDIFFRYSYGPLILVLSSRAKSTHSDLIAFHVLTSRHL